MYALVDAKQGGLYASTDGGATWTRASADRRIWERGWYFGGVTVDPKDANTVYACDVTLYRSTDGGKTFLPIKGAPGGDDYHSLWIDPAEPRRMILGTDQGAVVSVDGAKTWSSWYNQPTAQFYHVATDDRDPYWIYGAQQDSGAAATPSRTDYASITLRDWRPVAVGGENGYIAPDPAHPDTLFGGGVSRFDWKTLQEQDVDPTLAHPGDYRGEWTLPLAISASEPGAIYFGNQFLFRSTDGGGHWEKISDDLTREAPGVPATLDPATAADSATAGPRRGVIYAVAPSPLAAGLVWCGTDDGLIWLTRDGGRRWQNVTPPALTPWSKVGILEASHFDADTVYAAIDRHRLDDLDPHIYRTRDGGKTWTSIVRGIPAGSFVNVVREDPERRGLLYAGTETGVFVSFNDGEDWQALQGNLPNCSVRDISVRRGDLVLGTHGRSFWVLDDLSPLRQLDAKTAAAKAWLFAPRDAVRLNPAGFQGTPEPRDEPSAENPPRGAVLDYLLQAPSTAPVVIEILDANGALVRRYASDDVKEPPDLQAIRVTEDWVPEAEPPSAAAGLHRVVWDLHYAPRRGTVAIPARRHGRLGAARPIHGAVDGGGTDADPGAGGPEGPACRGFRRGPRRGSSSWRAASKPIACAPRTALASATSLRKQAAAARRQGLGQRGGGARGVRQAGRRGRGPAHQSGGVLRREPGVADEPAAPGRVPGPAAGVDRERRRGPHARCGRGLCTAAGGPRAGARALESASSRRTFRRSTPPSVPRGFRP